jgi:hypothetical protein
MSAAFVLPFLQARAEFVPILRREQSAAILKRIEAQSEAAAVPESHNRIRLRPAPRPHLAFYRKYTEALLRRYLRMSLDVGRVPSILGREMFRAKVSSYRMESFEDAVIFCHDIERCIQRLTANEQLMIEHLALKQYTVAEAAQILRTSPKTIIWQYTGALDRLTRIFIALEILKLPKSCQAPTTVENASKDM